ncbi:MAG: glycosyltransferase family 39 protein [Acidobacteriota bacterium]
MTVETRDGRPRGHVAPRVEPWEVRYMALLLVVLAGVLVSIAWRTGVTIDEPAHLLSAHLYWKGNDTLLPGDMPPAIKIVGGWVSHLFPLPIPYDNPVWETQLEWDIARVMMDRLRDPLLRQVFFFSRLPLIVFPLMACTLLWWWARQLFSRRAALALALLFCLSPTVLAHGALFKNDLAASFGYLLFWYRAWVYWQSPSGKNAGWLGAGILVGILAKFSLLILAPLGVAVVLARYFVPNAGPRRALGPELAVLFLVPYLGTVAAWQFHIDTMIPADYAAWRANPSIPAWAPEAAAPLRAIPTPQRLRQGVMSLVESNATGTGVYLMGKIYPMGVPQYFAVALATKVPISLQLLFAAALALLIIDLARRRLQVADLFWIVPPILYFCLASLSSLQLGLRLILPALLGLTLWCGRPVEFLLGGRKTVAVLGVLIGWLAIWSAHQYPYYLSHFNELVGGSDQGIRYLSDSNLDWGQDLDALAEYLQRNRIPKIYLAYFGADNPYAHIPENRLEQIAPPWGDGIGREPRIDVKPGYYAVSATLLTGQLFQPKFRDYYKRFRDAEPIAKAGYSIFIYKVPNGGGGPAGPPRL